MNSQVFAMYEFCCGRIQVFRLGCVYSEYKGYSLGTLLVRMAHDGSFQSAVKCSTSPFAAWWGLVRQRWILLILASQWKSWDSQY